jgi:hypothetical protein
MWKPSLVQTGQTVIAGHDPLSPVIGVVGPILLLLFMYKKIMQKGASNPSA